jgi:hypothetical protein
MAAARIAHTVSIMSRRARLSTSCAALLALALLSGPAGAIAQVPGSISGKLSQPGYTVIALADSGQGVAGLAANGAFKLKPPATEVTLQLRAPDGAYAGPIVFQQRGNPVKRAKKRLRKAKRALRKAKRRLKNAGRQAKKATTKKAAKRRVRKARRALKRTRLRLKKARRALKRARRLASGREAILGVRAGAKLGKVAIHSAAGYAKAKLTTRQWRKWVDQKHKVTAAKGVPIGNGVNVGLVYSTAHGFGDDLDRDGVSNSLDVDDDGDLILDKEDPLNAARASQYAHQSLDTPHPVPVFGLGTQAVGQAMNAYSSSDQQIAALFRSELWLSVMWGGVDPGSAQLDCGALSYCSLGGTGRLQGPGFTDFAGAEGFPRPCCDPPDGDGLGALTHSGPVVQPDFYGMTIFPGATPDQIHPGDVLIERATRDGAVADVAVSQGFILSTFPALAHYDDGQGDSGDLSYPRDELAPLPVRANSSGDVVVNLTFWRPQRLPVASETAPDGWIDAGHLNHVAVPQDVPPSGVPSVVPLGCPASSYSDIGANLIPQPAEAGYINAYHLQDIQGDQPTDRQQPLANTFSYTLNLKDCLESYGVSMDPGSIRTFSFFAVLPSSPPTTGNTQSVVRFQLAP